MKLAQRLQKGAPAAAAIVLVKGKMLQKYQQAKYGAVPCLRHADLTLLAAPVFVEPFPQRVENRTGQRIVGPALVIDAALQRAVRSNETIQCFRDIAIDHTRNLHGGLVDRRREE